MSQTTAEIRPYAEGDKMALLEMVGLVYDEEVRKRHELMWDWWQRRNCQATEEHNRPTVIERKGKLAGFMGLQPRRFKIGPEVVEGVFALDSFTNPADRGVGVTLFRHLLKTTALLSGAPIPRVNQLWKKLLDDSKLEVFNVRKGKRVINAAAFLPARVRPILNIPVRLMFAMMETALASTAPRLRNINMESITRFPPIVDDLCNRWSALQAVTAMRDSTYLNWRFADAPVGYEKRLLWESGKLIGLAAFRVGLMNGRRILILVELIAEHKNLCAAYGSLIAHALDYARKTGVADVQTLDTGCPAMRKAMQRWGFFFRPEKPHVIAKYRDDRSDSSPILNKDWFISAGDSDFEFTYFNQGWESLEGFRV